MEKALIVRRKFRDGCFATPKVKVREEMTNLLAEHLNGRGRSVKARWQITQWVQSVVKASRAELNNTDYLKLFVFILNCTQLLVMYENINWCPKVAPSTFSVIINKGTRASFEVKPRYFLQFDISTTTLNKNICCTSINSI